MSKDRAGQMAKKTPIDKLQANIDKLLSAYAESVNKDVSQLAKDFAKKGALAVKQSAQAKGWGEHTGYAQGWTSQFIENRYSAQGVIFNKTVPGLPHLLENGHALRNGGRSRAIPHIAPVEEKLVQEFQKAVEGVI